MKRYTIQVLLLMLFLLAAAENVQAIEGLRGATWGELRWDMPREGEDNVHLQGWVKQGIDWKRWDNTTLNTYGAFRFRMDSLELDWNNSFAPAVGISIDMFNESGVALTWGVEYMWDRFYKSDRTEEKLVIYMGWYGWWDLKGK